MSHLRAQPTDPLINALPDLIVLVRRDGTVLAHGGGLGLSSLKPDQHCVGKRVEAVWPEPVAELLKRLTRGAIATRARSEAKFQHDGLEYEARATAQGPDRALCVIRALSNGQPDDSLAMTGELPRPQLDRRGFLQRFKDTMALAALSEKPTAVAVIQVDGMTDVAQLIDGKLAEQLMSAALLRLSSSVAASAVARPWWFLGQLGDSLLALVIESSDRDAIQSCVAAVCASLNEPLNLNDAAFQLTPYAGVAVLGRDATSPRILLDHARSAATQARRSGSREVCFFSDTVRLRSLARLDIARELDRAINHGDIRLKYVGRHDLASGRLVAWVGYLRWMHPVRGEVRPVDFLRVAESTGLATALSRVLLRSLQQDYAALAPQWGPDVRLSFGALRHHILDDEFVADILRLLEDGAVPAERLELRIGEKTLIAGGGRVLQRLHQRGIQLIVDEVGRGLASLDELARAPIWGLQLDRAWVTASRSDPAALKVCRAVIGLADGLGLNTIASGVDDAAQRQALLDLGVRYGSGDLYRHAVPEIMQSYRAAVSD
jgi:predicted signal transduction protein with EAL and GGDEF domain